MTRYFSPYMIQIIKLTKDWRDDFINQSELINSVINIADTYEETMINYKAELMSKVSNNMKEASEDQ